jgi:glycosyltransferase involved in cell wall biosynthesis
MSEKLITIVIPTFNRPNALAECLKRIFPQCESRVSLVVRDNHSIPSVEAVFNEFSLQFPRVDAVYKRNTVNIGIVANILRCFEEVETQWIWVLGDDDIIKPDAVENIINNCAKWPDAGLFGFVVENFKCTATDSLSTHIEARSLYNLLSQVGLRSISLISSAVYNVGRFRPLLEIGYRSSHTYYPHLAMVIRGYESSGFYAVGLPTSIVNYSNVGHSESTWSISELRNFFELQHLISEESDFFAFRDCDLSKFIQSIYYKRGLISEYRELLLLPLKSTTSTDLAARMVYLLRYKINILALTYRRLLYPCVIIHSLAACILVLAGRVLSPLFKLVPSSIRRRLD